MTNDSLTNGEAALQDGVDYMRSIVDTVREPLLILDGSLRVTTASHAFYETFRVSPAETIGRFIYDLGAGHWNIPALRTLLEEVLPQQKAFANFEVTHEFPGIGPKVMLLNARKLWRQANASEHVLLAIEDVTERNRIADELVRSNEALQRFAYVAAHDLRSPLNSALKLLTLLSRHASTPLEESDAQTLDLAMSNLHRLRELMEDLLTYSAAENAPRRRAIISLEEPLKIALANLQHHVEAAAATVTADVLPTVSTDRTQMVMVFQNLIGNAIKYRGELPPTIRIAAKQNDGNWQIGVKDNGQGFPQEQAERIFEPFRRLHGPEVPGSGIGLATCKRVIEGLGGKIGAQANAGEGSTFFFTIPVATQ